jgi:lipopolysaccharide export system protein LptC
VRITYGTSSLTGVGMEFDNSSRVLNVLSNVRGVWTPPPDR